LALLAAMPAARVAAAAAAADAGQVGPGVPAFTVRAGYKVTLAADKLDEARFMEFDDKGNLYLSQPGRGQIVRLQDKDGDGVYETRVVFVSGKKSVHGMFFNAKDGWLYFTQPGEGSVGRARDDDGDGKADKVEEVLPPGTLPAGGGHPFHAPLITDDGASLLVTTSDRSNMTPELDSPTKTIYRFDLATKSKSVFATGVRNTEKIRYRPGTSEIYGFDHGSDNFGQKYGDVAGSDQPITDLMPPEKLNLIKEGGFYGHPYLVANKVPRPEFADRKDLHELADKMTNPAWTLGAHWAVCGWTFLSKDYFPGHKGDLFAACHGSWNAAKKVGYRVERVMFDPMTGRPYGSWMIVGTLSKDGGKVLARPTDCAEAPDGTVLFSSDMTKQIYRISKAE
jgi:glucose/arabinose dehydrogenase